MNLMREIVYVENIPFQNLDFNNKNIQINQNQVRREK